MCGHKNSPVLFVNLVLLIFVLWIDLTVSQRQTSIPWNWRQQFQHEKSRYFQGDIVLRPNDIVRRPGASASLLAGSTAPRWRDGVIYYAFHPSISVSGRQAVFNAMRDIQSKTCVTFKYRNNERDYVGISNFNQGCFSYVGRSGGKQQLNLGQGCWHKTTIIHELVHAIGFWHEQSRLDRDNYIEVQWNNIPRNFWREFQKYEKLENFGTEYDLLSVMHYSYNAFAKDKRRPTIKTKQAFPLRFLGTGDDYGGLTETDAYQINQMYGCSSVDDPRKKNRGRNKWKKI